MRKKLAQFPKHVSRSLFLEKGVAKDAVRFSYPGLWRLGLRIVNRKGVMAVGVSVGPAPG
jgi:hypothetical protein